MRLFGLKNYAAWVVYGEILLFLPNAAFVRQSFLLPGCYLRIIILTKLIFDMGKFLSDFKEFAMKGNVIDMAVGVIIGGAFGKIVSSLVNDVIMPVMSVCTGGLNFKDMKHVITPATEEAAEVAVTYGVFIQNIIDFLIIAFSIFVALRVMMKFKKKEEEAPVAPPAPTKEEELLTEIRDLLKKQQPQ